jgi:hypothetical protein
MRVLKSRAFDRFARSTHVGDADLWEAVERAEKGLVDANLGGGVIKQRIARGGKGKSAGFRSIIFYKSKTLAVFVFGFEKSSLANISPSELKTFKDAAKVVLKLTENELGAAIKHGAYIEVAKPAQGHEEASQGRNRV